MIAERVKAILEDAAIEYCLIGAVAVAARGAARSTQDLDLFTTDRRVFQEQLWTPLRVDDIPIDIRKGDFDDPLAGVIRFGHRGQVDIVVGKWKWEDRVIKRAERVDVDGVVWPIATRSDLVLLKVAAGGGKDLIDAATLLRLGARDEIITHVNGEISHLPKDARETWAKLLV